MILADLDIPLSAFTGWLPGLLAFLFLIALLLTIWNAGKNAFGRRLPIDDELEARDKRLHGEIYHAKNSVRKELADRLDKAETAIEDMRLDRERKWKELGVEYSDLKSSVDYMRGRVDALLKKLEIK
jgi:hypothetical protein